MHNPISSWAIRGFSSIENKGFLKPYQSILLWRNNSPINSSSLPIPRTSGSVRPSSIRVFGFSCTEKVSLPLQIAWPTKIFTKPIKKKSTPNPQNEKKKKMKWNQEQTWQVPWVESADIGVGNDGGRERGGKGFLHEVLQDELLVGGVEAEAGG